MLLQRLPEKANQFTNATATFGGLRCNVCINVFVLSGDDFSTAVFLPLLKCNTDRVDVFPCCAHQDLSCVLCCQFLVIEPVRMVFPVEMELIQDAPSSAVSNRRKSPISQTNCMAEISPMPRKPCRI